jgi:anti-anti-sigma factor
MQLTVDTMEGGVRCLHLNGRLDLKGTQEVEAQFTAQAGGMKQSIIVDLSGVDYIASVGIRLLLSNLRSLTAAKARMVILKPQKMVEDVLKLAGLDSVVPIEHDPAAAVELAK